MPRSPRPEGWCVVRRHQEQTYFAIFALAGRLAQLVQSTSFTPRGRGFESLTAHQEQSSKAPSMKGLFAAPKRTKIACGRDKVVNPFGATPQCFLAHRGVRYPRQTNCHPPRSRLLSLHLPRRLAALPVENP